ncbi:MAG TPA: DUF3379 family protein [Steroidobacteraceae bacterium]|nr:DUF3379 family protein [Steroidobacteraceae bacterium]
MIDCSAFRRALLADPHDPRPELAEHRASCAECAGYAQRVLLFEERLERALRVTPPARQPASGDMHEGGRDRATTGAGAAGVAGTAGTAVAARAAGARAGGPAGAHEASRTLPLRRRRALRVRGGWLAAAASVLIVLAMMTSLWLAVPHASLAADVVAHMAGEPQAWTRTGTPVPAGQLDRVLREARVSIAPGAPMVSYAQSCWFRGHQVPHLVVQTEHGPVTVMVLVHESVKQPVRFDEGGYRGVLLPDDAHGSLAVLARDRDADLDAVRATAVRVRNALVWQG